MIPSTQGITPLRQRMIDDMRMRKLGPKTQTAYIRAVRKFAGYLGRSPDTAAAEDLSVPSSYSSSITAFRRLPSTLQSPG